MDLWHFFGDLHPKLVHFPLVLLLAGLLFDAVGLAMRSARCHWAAKILTSAGTVLLLITFICGIYAEIWAGRAGVPQDAIELHELFANIASWGFVILAAWRLFLRDGSRKTLLVYTVLGLAWYGLMVLTAHLGGALVYDYGAAVTGARAGTPMSLHDLNTLATRQTDLNLRYSEMMHHIFGYLTLALAGSLFAHALLPRHADRIRWVGPTLLLLGGIFLFFCADLDLYRLTDLRQLWDREVQLHKTIAIVLTVAGVAGLRRAKRRHAAEPSASPEGAPTLQGATDGHFQAKMVAVMALIGGGLLFTHVHTVAPYANVAAGVYVAHVTLGTVALLIGATRLLADALPRRRRALSIAFSLLLCLESVLLITYNEGLPWYVGYGRYNRWGPHGGTVAPYGDRRAELTFDEKTQRLDVYVLDRFKDDKPVAVPASQLDVLIARGYQETAIAVNAVPDEGGVPTSPHAGVSHFAAIVPFLKDAPAFCARMALPMPARGGGVSMKMGYFDPWVTPVIAAVPPNEVARFQCPMHEGIRATDPGECPLCGMPLVPITRGIRTTLHDDGYDLRFSDHPVQTAAATDAHDLLTRHLRFTPMHSGATLRHLTIVHEHPLHLIVVSDDLRFFDHVHPVPQPDGSLALDYTFPAVGRYLLFADITPQGARSQVFRLPVTIGNPPQPEPAPQPPAPGTELLADVVPATSIEQDPSITVELVSMPRALVAGPHAQLVFRLTRNGQPLIDLQPYLGAMGHCVILSKDTQTYLHCHPEQFRTPTRDDRGGPEVVFHARFPRPGTYKLWAQFNHHGHILIAPFTLHVGRPILPPKIMAALFDD